MTTTLEGIVQTIESEISSIVGDFISKEPSSATVVNLGGFKITWGGLRQVYAIWQSLPSDKIQNVLSNNAGIEDAVTIATDIVEYIAASTPYSGPVDLIAPVIAALIENNAALKNGTPITSSFKEAGR